jgi:transposase InsO family protein
MCCLSYTGVGDVNEPLAQPDQSCVERQPKPGLIHHRDQGILYSSASYLASLKMYGMLRGMSAKGNCQNNAVKKSLFSSLKNEIVHHRNYHTRDEARPEIFEYIELFYNRKGIHQSLDSQTPMKYESVKPTQINCPWNPGQLSLTLPTKIRLKRVTAIYAV